jgi:hypothetical protein
MACRQIGGELQVMLYCLKHQWVQKTMPALEVIDRMKELIEELEDKPDSASLVSNFHLPRFTLVSQHIQKHLPVKLSKAGGRSASSWALEEASSSVLPSRLAASAPGVPNQIVSLQSLVPANKPNLIAKAYFCLAQWKFAVNKEFTQEITEDINANFTSATEHAPTWGKLWHKLGIFNMLVLRDWVSTRRPVAECTAIISLSVKAFFMSVNMCCTGNRHETLQVRNTHACHACMTASLLAVRRAALRCACGLATALLKALQRALWPALCARAQLRSGTCNALSALALSRAPVQDVLRLLTLWYRYGGYEDVQAELEAGFKAVSVETWLVAIPQMMARIHVDDNFIVEPLKELLVKIGRNHPQALMHPLLVRHTSTPGTRRIHARHFAASECPLSRACPTPCACPARTVADVHCCTCRWPLGPPMLRGSIMRRQCSARSPATAPTW